MSTHAANKRNKVSDITARRATIKDVDHKIELLAEQQRGEHLKTRGIVVAVALPSALKALTTLGAIGHFSLFHIGF
jgi:hypothetical protein